MDHRRRWVLTNLRSFINLLDEEKSNQTFETKDYRDTRNLGIVYREKYPVCPVMARRCPEKQNAPFEYTLRAHTSVPYYEKMPQKCVSVHVCSPSTTLHFKPLKPEDNCKLNGYKYLSRPSITNRSRMNPCKYKKSQELCKIKKYLYCDSPLKQSRQNINRENDFFGRSVRPLRRLQTNRIALPKLCKSKELRGGFMYQGCDCDKTNGLQDRCLRFCCLENPKCKTRPAACYLSRFSGGRHLPDTSTRPRTTPTHVDFKGDYFHNSVFSYKDVTGTTEDPSLFHEGRESFVCENYGKATSFREDSCPCEKKTGISFPNDFCTPEMYYISDGRKYPCCAKNTKVFKPFYNSPQEYCRFLPNACVCCPLSYIKSFNVLCTQ